MMMWWIIVLIVLASGGMYAYFRLKAKYDEIVQRFDALMDAMKNIMDSIVRVMVAFDTDPAHDTKVELAVKIVRDAVDYLSTLDDLQEQVDAATTKEEKKEIIKKALEDAVKKIAEQQGVELTESLLKTIDFVAETMMFFL